MGDWADRAYARLAELERGFSGVLGIAALGSRGAGPLKRVSWNEDECFPTASVIKVPILYTCLRMVDHGLLHLDQRITLKAEDQVAGSGILRDLAPGLEPTLKDLLMLMIIVSDNTATNMVIDIIGGVHPVNEDAVRLGCSHTRLVGKLMLPPERRTAEQRAGVISTTTPHDMLRYMQQLSEGRGLSPRSAEVAQSILFRQHYTDSLTRFLPWEKTQPDDPWRIAAKSGSIQGVRNQVGWIETDAGRCLFAILTKECTDLRFYGENEGNVAVARAFRILFDHFFGA